MSYLRIIIVSAITFFCTTVVHARIEKRLEDGLAITHPRIIKTLEQRASGEGIGLGYYLKPNGPAKISNKELSMTPNFKKIITEIDKEAQVFKSSKKSKYDTAGVGLNYHNRMFDTRFLSDDRAIFSLVGVVNRLDKTYKDPERCGETRLIYRLAYRVQMKSLGEAKSVASRLPMTINLVLHARPKGSALTCQEIARRWSQFNVEGLAVSKAVDMIFGANGPLSRDLRDRSLIKSLEINLQLARKAAAVRPDFGGHAVYLLKVFKWNEETQEFSPTTLENQVDRSKAQAFYDWLFEPEFRQKRISELDKGTIVIPESFLAKRAYSIAPGGMARQQNHPLGKKIKDDVIAKKLDSMDLSLFNNIKSVEGFKRRVSDISCSGCHQTRAIGGFHFMGQDPTAWVESYKFKPVYPGNAVVVPGSGHFFADLMRRREILKDIASGVEPNYGTGFSSRPQEGFVDKVEDSGLFNGWGAHCYTGDDPSFKSWSCSAKRQCLQLYDSSVSQGMGVCISKSHQEIGDPTESGKVSRKGKLWFSDHYKRKKTYPLPGPTSTYVNSPQSASGSSKTGGFPGGAIRTKSCGKNIMSKHAEAGCGALPAASSGFNNCLFNPKVSFDDCVKKYSKGVGLRSCSRNYPCRDDYICAESFEKGEDHGVCVPPYFLFQFRVDGHPIKF